MFDNSNAQRAQFRLLFRSEACTGVSLGLFILVQYCVLYFSCAGPVPLVFAMTRFKENFLKS